MKHFFLIVSTSIILWSCANQTQPNGGPKDKDPPYLLSSDPPNESLNFKGNTIELNFSEMIKQDNLQKNLIITPTIKGKYKVKIIRNRVTLSFDTPFQDSTTYTFNFRKSIKDVTESNPAENLFLVFSTGNALDSLTIQGNVTDLLTGQPQEDYIVALYSATDTLDFLTGPPFYATVTNKSGQYQFQNLRAGQYNIFAFNDKNSNLTCQTQSEPYGFLPEVVQLDSSLANIDLQTQFLDLRDFRITGARPSGQYYEIRVNKPIRRFSLTPLDSSVWPDTLYRNRLDEDRLLRFYNTFDLDSLPVIFQATDSANFQIADTLYVKFTESTRPPEEMKILLISSTVKVPTKEFKVDLSLSKPIKEFNPDSISILADSIYFPTDSISPTYTWNQENLTLSISGTLTDSIMTFKNLIFNAAPGTFISIENDTSKLIKIPIKQLNPDSFGTLTTRLDTPLASYIIQLLDQKNKLVSQFLNKPEVKFEYLNSGKYTLRLLIDKNLNGQWDPGNYLHQQVPEPVIFFYDEDAKTSVITVKKNWILGPYILQTNPEINKQ